MADVNKVVLAYSGGLDTSVILKWLQDTYNCEVVTFTADLGQGEEVEPARAKAQAMGVKEIYIDDLREEFVRDFVFPMFRANTVYEGEYLLGTSIARPLIAKRLIEIANETGADAISHGATGKGNDFTVISILQPLQDHRSVQAARISQNDLVYVRHAITPRVVRKAEQSTAHSYEFTEARQLKTTKRQFISKTRRDRCFRK